MQFHNDRKHTKSRKIKAVVYNLHCGKDVDDLQPATKNVLAKAQSESGLSNEVAKMVEEIRVLSPLNVPENFEGKNHKPPPAEVYSFFTPGSIIVQC